MKTEQTPLDTMNRLLEARSRKDMATALACYEPGATVVVEPGKVASGDAAIEAFTAAAMDLPIAFGEHRVVESGDIALHLCKWTLSAPGAQKITGCTTDVLRRQRDGSWLLVLDNAWGTGLIGGSPA